MKEMIAYCGLICNECPAYIAHKNDNEQLRIKTAKQWSKEFKADIKPEGYKYISLGSKFKRVGWQARISKTKLEKTATDTIRTLLDPDTKNDLDKNFRIGKKYHGEKAMNELLKRQLYK